MPISNNFSFPKSETKTFDAIPADVYEATIKDIEDKVSHFKADDGSDKMVLNFTFQIEEEPHKGRLVWKEIAPYVKPAGDKKASILFLLASILNNGDLTPEECASFGPEQVNGLINNRLRIVVGQKTSGSGKVYNNITGFLPSKVAPTAKPSAPVDVDDIPFHSALNG